MGVFIIFLYDYDCEKNFYTLARTIGGVASDLEPDGEFKEFFFVHL